MKYWLLLFGLLLLASCNQEKTATPTLDIAETKDDLIKRFDHLVHNASEEELKNQCEISPEFCKIYFENVLGLESDRFSPAFFEHLRQFTQDSFFLSLQPLINQKFDNLSGLENDFKQIIGRLKTLIPQYQFDHIYTFTSGFSYQAFIFSEGGKDALGIGLDMFLHPDINYKELDAKNPAFADYLTQSYTPDHIATKASAIIADDIVPTLKNKQRMLDHMIRNGKKLYLTEQLLPEKPKHIISDYTKNQHDWCIANEKDTWGFFLEKELLYETDIRKINKFINPSPDAPGMPKAAPGRVANFIGWQIIKSYMKRNKNIGIIALINNSDAQSILQKSKYKPSN